MPASNGPNTVTDGLILCLDAGNRESYPGSGTSWNDLSTNSLSGTLVNAPTYSSSNLGYISFSGASSQYINIGDVGALKKSHTSLSIAVWLRRSSFVSETAILGKMGGAGSRGFQFTCTAAGLMDFTYFNNTAGTSSSSTTSVSVVPTSTWIYLAFTFTASGTNRLYINGIQNATSAALSTLNGLNSEPFRIANRGSVGVTDFTGDMSVVHVYETELSAASVLQNFNALRSRYGV